MKTNYWEVEDEKVLEKTGKKKNDWIEILDKIDACNKKSNDIVSFLQSDYYIPRYWARTLTTLYLKTKE